MIAPVSADVLDQLKSALGPDGWSADPLRLEAKLTEWRGRWRGETPLLALPRDVEAVQAVVSICAAHGVAITPQGGNTGLVAGQIPQGEILLSTERLNRIREVAPEDGVLVAEAGVTLKEAQDAAEAVDRLFALSLAAEDQATLGGAISTNAGGVAVLRYGVMRDQVLGLEAVMPDGRLFQGLKRLRKDNTGYDLKQLLIGAEGTLGVITAASLKLHPRPRSRATAIVALENPGAAIALLHLSQDTAGGGVEAFELMGRPGLDLVLKHIPGTRDPLPSPHAWYALVELGAGEAGAAESALERLLARAFETEMIADAVVAQSLDQTHAFWKLREAHSAAQKPEGAAWKHDVSVPVSRIPDFLARATTALERLQSGTRVVAFGHVGDGNIHFDAVQPERGDGAAFSALRDEAARLVHDLVAGLGGSISAEHGLGAMKTAEAARYKSTLELDLQRAVRAAIDPRRIMNPRVLF
jgi:FAD/FMN-containing dehydrogenase